MRRLGGLGLLLLVAILCRVAEGANGPNVLQSKNRYIHGNLNEKVHVYVKVYRNSPFLACMDEVLSQEEVIDPLFLWIGPDGRNLKGQDYVNVTETGKLSLKTFHKSMSGSYSCTLTYKRMKDNLQEEKETYKTYKFMLFAYRDPDYTFQVNARFSTSDCHNVENEQYFEELKKVIEDLIFSLTCQLTDAFLKCHVIKVPKHGLQDVLFITFKVNPFAPGWEVVCRNHTLDCGDETNSRILQSFEECCECRYHQMTSCACVADYHAIYREHLLQARDRIEEFFLKQTQVQKKKNNSHVPSIHYLDKSLHIVHQDRCRPGFGKDEFNHADCPDCCVVCGPDTYNSNNGVRCQHCSSIRINYYGATAC